MTSSTLLDLPGELQNAICTHLDYISALRLSSTCRRLHFEQNPTTLFTHSAKLDAVFAPEAWSINAGSKGAHACSHCFFTLPRDRFALSQVTWPRIKGKLEGRKRFCLDCGLKTGTYAPGSQITMTNGKTHVKCYSCPRWMASIRCDCGRPQPWKGHTNRNQTFASLEALQASMRVSGR